LSQPKGSLRIKMESSSVKVDEEADSTVDEVTVVWASEALYEKLAANQIGHTRSEESAT
jgi:hypothetical protein